LGGLKLDNEHNKERNMEELLETVKKAAKSVAFQWPGVIEADDVEQEIWVHLLERPGTVTKILDKMDDSAKYRAIVGIGHQIASKERNDYSYYSGNYKYSLADVKKILVEKILTSDEFHWNEAVSDIRESIVTLKTEYREAIAKRYVDGEVPAQGAPAMELTRAIESLTDAMNSNARRKYAERDEGLGTRKVISNAQARAITDNDYEGWEGSEYNHLGGWR
jgi:hypothetical protein